MTPLLRASVLAVLTASFLALGLSRGAFADGRDDWSDYAWQSIAVAECTGTGTTLRCPLFHEKWDWKRDQWVDIAIMLDLAKGTLNLTQRLTNNDSYDHDNVCVTALAVDEEGRDIVAHHQNWYSKSGTSEQRDFAYRSGSLSQITTIHIGSKQCRQSRNQDDALYARVLAGIGS